MAIAKIDAAIAEMYHLGYAHLKQEIGRTEYTEFDITPAIFGDAMMRSFTRAVEDAIPPQQLKNNPSYRNNLTQRVAQANTLVNWRNAMKDHHITMKGRSVLGYKYPKAKDLGGGIILLSDNGVGTIKVLHSPTATISYDTWYNNYKDAVWAIWKTNYGSAFTGGGAEQRRGGFDYRQTATGGVDQRYSASRDEYFAEATHDPKRTIPLAELALRLPDILGAHVTFQGREGDLVKEFLATTDLKWIEEQVGKTPRGLPILVRKLVIVPGKRNPVGPYDLDPQGGMWSILRGKFHTFLYDNFDFADPATGADIKGSPSFRQQAAAAAQYTLLRELMKKNAKRVTKKKIKTKQLTKKRPVKKTYKSPVKVGKGSIVLAMRGKPTSTPNRQGQEKGQGKEASTSTAADLARLKKLINSKLPAEVRRNMGRPALQNQTGRFSNSVQLLSLHQAKETIMAKYTYLLSPYQTFENTGSKRWPLAYNPKTLIAKSIRNLALGRIQQKLTVRRV